MLSSNHNPDFAHLLDSQVLALYVVWYNERRKKIDSASDADIDKIDRELFLLDDELCARGLDLPC